MKKFLSVLLVFSLIFVFGCSSQKNESSSQLESEVSSEASDESSELSSEENEIPEPTYKNLLTGLEMTAGGVNKRPVAVMVNNIKDCLPQYGIEKADIIFEIPVEADITRLMALYGDYSDMPDICSVRSARYYYALLSLGYDAIYAHWGADGITAAPMMAELGMDDLDGDYGLCGRDQNRLNSGFALEHTGVFYGSELKETLDSVGYRTDIDPNYNKPAFSFVKMGEKVIPTGSDAKFIDIFFGNMTETKLEYNSHDEKYYKYFSSNPHIDGNTGAQLAFDNVFILETTIGSLGDVRKSVDWRGGEDSVGFYISKGKIQRIHWSKESEFAPLVFKDESGNELTVNRGKSYIAINYFDSFTFE